MVRRVQADFENYKKRTLRQQTDQLDRATENLVAKLLPALDAFALTRAHLNDESAASPEVKALLQAAGLIDDALAKEGLERIDDAGAAFDPTIHDAVEHAPAAEPGGSGPVAGRPGDNRSRRRHGGARGTGGGRRPASRLPLEGPCHPPGHGPRPRVSTTSNDRRARDGEGEGGERWPHNVNGSRRTTTRRSGCRRRPPTRS